MAVMQLRTFKLVARAPFSLLFVLILALGIVPRADAQADARFFPQTRQRIDNEQFFNFFKSRGGARTFGYPVSGTFTLHGFQVQIFQRQIMQLQPDGRVTLMNLLDEGVLPYTTMNGSVSPAVDQALSKQYPATDDPQYHVKALEFISKVAPDTWEG